MSLLTTASLVVTPNAGEEGTLFSIVPNTGLGDLSVTRATTATRVNSAGLVELVPYNLVQYSEDFANGYWSKYQSTITANNTTAPNGTLTADRLTQNGAGAGTFYVTPSTFNGGLVSLSCFYKKGIGNVGWLEINRGAESCFIQFNLDTQVISASGNYASTNIESVGNGWFRCSVVSNQSAGTANYIGFGNIGNNGDSIFAWGAQLNEGTIKPYQKTETRLNIPRLDYSNGTCPSILVEPQRTNSCLYSNKISDSTWLKFFDNGGSAPIITDNYAISPDGSQNAQRIQLTRTTATNSYSYILQNITGVAGQSYTWSVWLKSLSGTPSVALSNIGGSYANIVTISNEWERYEFTTAATGTSLQAMFLLFEQLTTTSLTADFLVYGFQVEAGSYATSYIPTTSASVTRNADVISKTGISSLIGQTEGTIFWDTQKQLGENDVRLNLSDGTTNNWLFVGVEFSNYTRIYCNVGGVNQMNIYGPQLSNDFHKIAFAYKANDFVLYVDGVQVASHTSGSVPNCSRIDINAAYPTSGAFATNNNKAVALWKTRLTNAQLATLTTI